MDSEIRLGLVPTRDDAQTADALAEIAEALARIAEMPVRVRRLHSPTELVEAFAADEIDLIWSSPSLALQAPELRDAVPVVSSVREGVAHYHGVLFVRADSPIRSLLQLRGARVAWVAATSAAGYIFPRVALAGHGLDPAGPYASERFLGSHGAVADAVRDGEADVGATFAVFEGGDATRAMVRSGFDRVAEEQPLRVVLATPPIPADLFLATPALDLWLDGRLAEIMQRLVAEVPAAIRHVFGADAFVACERRPLDELRRQLHDARELGAFD